ncbi:MAG: class I SAM-dependent methyltransferase [Planctomycetota bacterium]|nr:MAG: class I SAM-dependent methyltransferase [Planctomycetota bacterium]
MLLVMFNKHELLQMLPKGGRWVEIGVFQGDFSERILQECQPETLHLVDPWHFELDFDWFAPPEYSPKYGDARKFVEQVAKWTGVPEGVHLNDHFEALHNQVQARFAGDARVTIHRQTAHDAAPQFADGSFDCVYVDGAHDYENVLLDLTTYERKLKPEGVLLGDDYCEHGVYANAVYGVVGAVTHFRKISTPRELVLNIESFTTFALFRPGSPAWQVFMDHLVRSGHGVIELPDALAPNYWHRPIFASDGKGRLIQSFA